MGLEYNSKFFFGIIFDGDVIIMKDRLLWLYLNDGKKDFNVKYKVLIFFIFFLIFKGFFGIVIYLNKDLVNMWYDVNWS